MKRSRLADLELFYFSKSFEPAVIWRVWNRVPTGLKLCLKVWNCPTSLWLFMIFWGPFVKCQGLNSFGKFTAQCGENDFRPQIWGLKSNSQFDPQVVESILNNYIQHFTKNAIRRTCLQQVNHVLSLALPERCVATCIRNSTVLRGQKPRPKAPSNTSAERPPEPPASGRAGIRW